MYCVTLRPHDIKNVCWIHHGSTSCWCLYFTFLVKVLPPPFHYSLGSYLYLFFVIHFTKSNLIARSALVLKLPEKMYIPSSRNISVTKKSSVCKKYRHKSICINITQLTTLYCYSATNSITNLSNKQLFFKKLKRRYHSIVYPILTLIPSLL